MKVSWPKLSPDKKKLRSQGTVWGEVEDMVENLFFLQIYVQLVVEVSSWEVWLDIGIGRIYTRKLNNPRYCSQVKEINSFYGFKLSKWSIVVVCSD